MAHERKIIIDFSDITLVSSSFADEVIGKLLVEIGMIEFMGRFELRNMSSMVRQIIERAIQQRMKA